MNKMKIKIFTLLSLLITFSLTLSSCDSLWDDLNSITVSFDSNSGTGTMEPQEFEADVPQALKENTFTRESYTFAGWATSADASKAEYADKAEFTAKEDVTLYAIWNIIPPAPMPSTYTITYVSDKGTLPESKTVEQGYKLTAEDLPTLTETGYRFINWDKAIDDEITSDTTITASWIKTWAISYASNKSELNDKLPASKTVDEGYKLTADDLTALTADDYNFKGWDKSAGLEIKADVTITATWKKVVTISYSSTYGTKPENKTVEEGYKLVSEDLKLLPETDTMYCDSWDKTVGTEINADTTIKAKWETIVYLKYSGDFKSDFPIPLGTTLKSVNIVKDHNFTGTIIDCAAGSVPDYFTYEYEINGSESTLWISGNGHRIYAPEDSNSMFYDLGTVTNIDLSDLYTSKVKIMDCMFSDNSGLTSIFFGPGFITSSVETMDAMFQSCHGLESLDLSCFDTSKVTSMYQMFEHCDNLKTLDVSSFNTEKVTNMSNMFHECKALTSLDVSKFITSSVTDMSFMFQLCSTLTTLNLSNFDTSKVTNMGGMFSSCTKLSSLNISNFDTTKVTGFANMFNSCTSLTSLDLSSFDTTAVMTIGATMCWGMFSNDGTVSNPLIIKVSSKWTINESNGLSLLGGTIQLNTK